MSIEQQVKGGGITYRPELDGLRALAVLSVIIYHAKLSAFESTILPGGYFGVDVFFVISGFLITKLLIHDIEVKGKFDAATFYMRRARRLLPSIVWILIVIIPISYYLLIPYQLHQYSKSALSSLIFLANGFFYFDKIQYGAEEALLQPLLHMWSLGVEAQFYLAYPLIFFGILAVGKYKAQIWLFGTLIVGFFVLALAVTNWNPDLSFFMLPSRLWEFFSGGVLVFVEKSRVYRLYFWRSRALSLVGLFLILMPIALVNDFARHPGLVTLCPVFGSGLLILCRDDFVCVLLRSRLLVYTGLISYSLYLWHYPIFSFARIATDSLSSGQKVMLIFLSFVAASISYALVEKPMRNASLFLGRSRLTVFLFFSLVLVAFSTWAIATNGWVTKVTSVSNMQSLFDENEMQKAREYVWREKTRRDYRNLDSFTFQSDRVRLLVVGDSNSGDLINALLMVDNHELLEIVSLRHNANCGAVYGDFVKLIEKYGRKDRRECINFDAQEFEMLVAQSDLVLWAQAWKEWEVNYFAETYNNLVNRFGDKFIYFLNKHTKRLTKQDFQRLNHAVTTPVVSDLSEDHRRRNETIKGIVGDDYIDYYELVCLEGKCPIVDEHGGVIQFDGFHLTEYGAYYLADKLESKLNLWIPELKKTIE